jgi:hypothetical protein
MKFNFVTWVAIGITHANATPFRIPNAKSRSELSIYGGEITEISEDLKQQPFTVNPQAALVLSAFAWGFYAAKPFSKNVTNGDELEANSGFWEGWFGTCLLLQTTIISSVVALCGNVKTKRNMCLAQGINWGLCVVRNISVRDQISKDAYAPIQISTAALSLTCLLAGAGCKWGLDEIDITMK